MVTDEEHEANLRSLRLWGEQFRVERDKALAEIKELREQVVRDNLVIDMLTPTPACAKDAYNMAMERSKCLSEEEIYAITEKAIEARRAGWVEWAKAIFPSW